MIATLLGLGAGVLVAWMCWSGAAASFRVDALERTNYRGRPVVTGIGVLIPVALAIVAAVGRLVVAAGDVIAAWDALTAATLVAAFGFCLLGLFDDVAGSGQSGGFSGHLTALRGGAVTSGMIKLLGGAAVGLLTVSVLQQDNGTVGGLLRDGATVALAANLGNLLDRAPGRSTKFTATIFVVLSVVAWSSWMFAPAVAVGAGLGLLAPDLKEEAMLGDAGANVMGAMCGIAALAAFWDSSERWAVLVALVALNVLSEVVSFSKVIDGFGPLRWFDRLGSMRTQS